MQTPIPLPQVDLISAKMDDLKSRLRSIETESIPIELCLGRVLAQDIVAFRDSPAIDVSAMDGYAVRWSELDGTAFPIGGTATAGSPPQTMAQRSAIRVFTGGPVPSEADCVVRREDCNESESYVTVCIPKESVFQGMNIRRQGENARAGAVVVGAGSLMSACRYAGAVTFSDRASLSMCRTLRIGIINTGDELVDVGKPLKPWQIRDSNGPFLESMLAKHTWCQVQRSRVEDQERITQLSIQQHLQTCDVLLLTGGVSMGDTDYVPDAIRSTGCKVIFHRIPIRPGRPMLGAVGPEGQLVLGLPGNPLSVAVTFRRYA